MKEEHRRSEALAAEAARLALLGDHPAAEGHYSDAADWEARAYAALDAGKSRTRSAVAVSWASLLYKSRRFAEAERAIFSLLAGDELLPWATGQLRELLEAVQRTRSEISEAEVATRIRSAVLREREACAQLVETVHVVPFPKWPGAARDVVDRVQPLLAAAIRKRAAE